MTAALILAAGCIGQNDKFGPADSICGASALKRLITVYMQAGIEKVVVITGFDAGRLERHCANMGALFLRNEDYECGDMLSSIKVGLNYLKDKCSRVFISPSDIPFFTVETVKKMDALNGAPAIAPVYNGIQGHPLLLSHELFYKVLEYECDAGLEGALFGENRCLFEVSDEGILFDMQESDNPERIASSNNLRIIRPEIKIYLSGVKSFFGPSSLKLLSLTNETGSLKLASRYLGISYSKAILMVADMEEQLGYKVLDSRQGGKHGGSSEITDKGRELMLRYDAFAAECSRFAEETFERRFENCGLW